MGLDLMLFIAIAVGYDVMFCFLVFLQLYAATFRGTDSFIVFHDSMLVHFLMMLQNGIIRSRCQSGSPREGRVIICHNIFVFFVE